MPALHRVVFPHPLNDSPEPEIQAALRERLGAIVDGLTLGATPLPGS